ncbi:MAG TPA: hypothetical protein VK780_11475 [Thermoanaerobaculia bacterium]|nr:hypothetical protein [Thermoanaerobaculia bacterium]
MKKRLLVSILFTGVLVALLWTRPAEAGVRVYVGVAPPPVVVETVPVAPSPRHVWIPGFHRWDGHAYIWAPGHYVVAPRARAAWVPGHWVHHRRGWYWRDGHWR